MLDESGQEPITAAGRVEEARRRGERRERGRMAFDSASYGAGKAWSGGKKVAGGIASGPFKILSFLGRLFRGSYKWILTLLIIFLIILAIIFGFNAWRGGTAGTLFTKGEVAAEETGAVRSIFAFLSNTLGIIRNPAKFQTQYGWEGDVIKNQDNRDLGVFIDTITIDKVFNEGQDIKASARLKAANGFEDAMVIKVTCSLEDYSGNVLVIGPREEGEQIGSEYEVIVVKEEDITQNIECEFPGGISSLGEGKEVEGKKLVYKAIYDGTTTAFLDIWYMDKNAFDEKRQEGKDVFEGIQNAPSGQYKTTRFRYSGGPLELGIGSAQSQPFLDERRLYSIGISLKQLLKWKGNRGDIKSLELHVPFDLFLNAERCDFRPTGRTTEDRYAIHTLKEDKLAEANNKCQGLSDQNSEECINKLNELLRYSCDFGVVDVDEDIDTPQYTTFRAKVNYVYETTTSKVATIQKKI